MTDPRTPCLVAAAQLTGREDDPAHAASPADLIAEAARRALAQARVAADAVDTLATVRLFADSGGRVFASPFGNYRNLPRAIARRIGADPARLIYGPVGGNTPQMLVNVLAERIWRGEAEVALITGGETLRTQAAAMKAGLTLDWGEDAATPPDEPFADQPLLSRAEAAHGLALPVNIYPLFETAFGAAKGWSVEEHRARIGALMAPFTEVAAENPYAQSREMRSAEELISPSPRNRWIAWPYTKRLVANMFVDQAAAVLLMSSERADALGVAADARVYLHGSADTHEKLLPVDRPDYARCPAIRIGAAHALEQAGMRPDALDPIDLYSCFPVAVEMAAEEIGLPLDDPASLTLTGGLPYFGGPGNAYSLHAIAEMIAACRGAEARSGLVFANGGFLTKHSFGVYSGRPGYGPRTDPATYQRQIDAMPSPPLEEAPSGTGTIEAYSVVHDRDGPAFAPIIGRIGDRRFLARMTDDLAAMMTANRVGASVEVDTGEKANVARLA